MNYNSGYKYNFHVNEGGLGYNSIQYRIIINLYDTIRLNDTISKLAAFISVFERPKFADFITSTALHAANEDFVLETDYKTFGLFTVFENLKISDEMSEVFVALYLADKFPVLDEIKQLNTVITTRENFSIEEIPSIDALITVAEKYKLDYAKKLFTLIQKYETELILDKEPRKAISDFVVGKIDEMDNAFDWIVPFDMMVDWKNSTIQVMPQTESNYIEMPGVDGSIPEYTVYKNRIFNIIAYSQDGLTTYEKEELKKDIVRILDSTKHQTKKLTFQASSTAFDVKYAGAADISEGPSFVKVNIPFEAGPYGYPLFDNEVFGSGLLVNNGAADVGCVNHISGGAVNPSFQLGDVIYRWNGTVPKEETLIIDHESYMCYLEDKFGNRTNALVNLTGNFQRIPKESSVTITALGNTESYLYTTLKERLLW